MDLRKLTKSSKFTAEETIVQEGDVMPAAFDKLTALELYLFDTARELAISDRPPKEHLVLLKDRAPISEKRLLEVESLLNEALAHLPAFATRRVHLYHKDEGKLWRVTFEMVKLQSTMPEKDNLAL